MRHGVSYLQKIVPEISQRMREFRNSVGRIGLDRRRRWFCFVCCLPTQVSEPCQPADLGDLVASGIEMVGFAGPVGESLAQLKLVLGPLD
jgi:hypothetical protein